MKEVDCYPGKRIGHLTLIRKVRIKNKGAKYSRGGWLCKCDCGNTISIRTDSLGAPTISCGCFNKENNYASDTNKLHQKYKFSDSQSNSKYYHLYNTWLKMKKRCFNPKDPEYKNYGGRGITICKSWLDYNNFKNWALSSGYSPNLSRSEQSIDRIDVDGDYGPENCRWANMYQQANNKTNTLYINFKGQKTTLGVLARKYHLQYQTLIRRYKIQHDRDDDLVRPPYAPKINN